jgi:hypothetical protein
MKAVIVRAIVAAVLCGAGWVCWTAGQLEARLTDANRQAIMLEYAGSLSEYDDIEQSLGSVARLPAAVTDLLGDIRTRRATAQYWGNMYGALSMDRDSAGELIEQNPDVLFVAANAAYRASQRDEGDRLATVRRLDTVIANYADVLRKSPGHVDAAYNYEFAVRARDEAVQIPETPRRRGATQADAKGGPAPEPQTGPEGQAAVEGDLPGGPTILGHPGAPPSNTDMKKFKMLVPMRPDERQGVPDKAGEGRRPLRRG